MNFAEGTVLTKFSSRV